MAAVITDRVTVTSEPARLLMLNGLRTAQATKHKGHVRLGDVELCGDGLERQPLLAPHEHLRDLFVSDLAGSRTRDMEPPFRGGILHVGVLVPEEQVRRVDAISSIARMENVLPLSDGAVGEFPHYAMHIRRLGMSRARHLMVGDVDAAVAIASAPRAGPQPAPTERGIVGMQRAVFVNARPESLFEWARALPHAVTCGAAILCLGGPATNRAGACRESRRSYMILCSYGIIYYTTLSVYLGY